jgi:hypothetical protein
MKKGILTFEIANKERLEIHADKAGLKKIISILQALLEKEPPEHEHLMTPGWGGEELCEEKQGEDNELLHNVKIFLWK